MNEIFKNPKIRSIEKKIYERLGVKFFINKILFRLEKIAKKLNINMNYRVKKYNLEGLEDAKEDAIDTGWAHLWSSLITGILLSLIIPEPVSLTMLIVGTFYCVMAQRYNVIRIDEKIEKIKSKQSIEQGNDADLTEKNEIQPQYSLDNCRPKFSFMKGSSAPKQEQYTKGDGLKR